MQLACLNLKPKLRNALMTMHRESDILLFVTESRGDWVSM